MTGRKVKLAFIANDCARRASYRRRKKSMLKKIEELSTLCGVEACAIVYSSFDQEAQIWPSESGVQNVVEKFRTMPEWKKHKMGNQESVMEKSIMKGKRKIAKLEEENKEMEITMFMFQCLDTTRVQPQQNMTLADLNLLSSVIEQKLNDVSRRLDLTDVTEVPYQPQIHTFVDTNLKL
ncbi:agamous-like MADS-box protein AGL80 [Vigna radiata var. radiata]|uniref:Agamous-like MADS-box protein AGL80 n=2 Tax=Vigna TaxID=3913 RepID=A0A1S3T780_VIGRR|nr:agamous-like MADS-box protein AGL80 [Vigna radiata var. radiata]